MAGFYFPQISGYTDRVLLEVVRKEEFSQMLFQNIGISEDFKKKVYSHTVSTTSGKIRSLSLVLVLSNSWGTDKKFSDLVSFLHTTINYGQKEFSYLSPDGTEYMEMRLIPESVNWYLIPGTADFWLITLTLEDSDDIY